MRDNKKPPLVILVTGKARSGKTSVAEMIRSELSIGLNEHVSVTPPVILGFSDAIKSIAQNNYEYENKNIDRNILLEVGDKLRNQNPNVFVETLLPIMNAYKKAGVNEFIFDDTRLKEEFTYIDENFSGVPYVIEVEREKHEYNISEHAKQHKTENGGLDYDFKIKLPEINSKNAGSIVKEIRRILDNIVRDYNEVIE